MRLSKLFLIPVLLVTASIASAQQPSAMKLQGRPRKVVTEWASGPGPSGTVIVQTAVMEGPPPVGMPGVMPAGPVAGPIQGGPVYGTSMGQCGSGGCGATACGSGACVASCCRPCDHGSCLSRLKAWLCHQPINACDKRVCYDPIPPLYQFFPCPREGYCPRLAPPPCCPPHGPLCHPHCPSCCKTSCGGCGSTCSASDCGGSECGTSACESGRGSWTRFFSPLRGGKCKDHCCTPSAQCFTTGQVTGGCAPAAAGRGEPALSGHTGG